MRAPRHFLPILTLATIFTLLCSVSIVRADRSADIQLVLQITIDQLRGDFPSRFKDRFGPAGFRHLMDNGIVYTDAHFRHSTTFTAVGHATLYTGGYAAQHGFAGNDWYDQETQSHVYCVEDPEHTLIGKKAKPHSGTSPRNLTSTTIGDELVLATGGKSRVYAVSIKDRGAIIPGGHLGKAFWYSKSTGEFVSSTYYFDDYPAWVKEWNKRRPADQYRDKTWTLLQPQSRYVFGNMDDRPFEKSYKYLGRTFPHSLHKDNVKAKDYYSSLRFTPMGDELTLEFVKTLIDQEGLGQRGQTDFLSISFSATDYIGHAFGPNSLEYEDNLLRLDNTLADLLAYIESTVGLNKTLIILSSDHGVDDIPEYKMALEFDAGRHHPKKFVASANSALQNRYGSNENFIEAFWNPSLYLSLATVKKLNLELAEIEQALAEEIVKIPGFALAVSRSSLLAGKITDTPITRRIQLAFHPKRSGNVLIVQDQFWYLYHKPEAFAAMHGSPYAYDTFVPVMFSGPGVTPATVSRLVGPEDIAPTIATYLGIKPPSGSVGAPLVEVLRDVKNQSVAKEP